LLLFFFIHGQEDQSAVSELTNRSETVQIGCKFGAFLSDLIVYKGFGLLLSCLFDYFLDRNIFDT
jgi:S-DNA-T family DNA segregation ATPase FtsK/SpoIIIE